MKRFEALPERRWRDAIVAALPNACDAIPPRLRGAAARVQGIKSADERARVLADAAQAQLGAACSVTEPMAKARPLAARCPLPAVRGFPLGGELDTMKLHQTTNNREPQSEATSGAVCGLTFLGEHIEDVRQEVGRAALVEPG